MTTTHSTFPAYFTSLIHPLASVSSFTCGPQAVGCTSLEVVLWFMRCMVGFPSLQAECGGQPVGRMPRASCIIKLIVLKWHFTAMLLSKANWKTGDSIESHLSIPLVNVSASESVPAPSAQQAFLTFPPVLFEKQTGFFLGTS